MEILEHMKTLERNGDDSKPENKPAAAKVHCRNGVVSYCYIYPPSRLTCFPSLSAAETVTRSNLYQVDTSIGLTWTPK